MRNITFKINDLISKHTPPNILTVIKTCINHLKPWNKSMHSNNQAVKH